MIAIKHQKKEKQFEQRVKLFLEDEGIYAVGTPDDLMTIPPCGYYVKRWGGGRYIPAGLPDLQMCVCGLCIDVELKAENGILSALQIQKIEQMQKSGCIAIVLRPSQFEQFKKLIDRIKYGEERDANKLFKDWLLQ